MEEYPETGEMDTERATLYKEIKRAASRMEEAPKPFGKSLCFSCQHSFIFRKAQHNDPIIRCTWLGGRSNEVGPYVMECNQYSAMSGSMDLHEMTRIATLIDIREVGGGYW